MMPGGREKCVEFETLFWLSDRDRISKVLYDAKSVPKAVIFCPIPLSLAFSPL